MGCCGDCVLLGRVTFRWRPRGTEEFVTFDSRLWEAKVDLVEISFMRSVWYALSLLGHPECCSKIGNFGCKYIVLVFSNLLNKAVIMVVSLELLKMVKIQNLVGSLGYTGFICPALLFSNRYLGK